jgi:hypothetical protein
MKLNKELKRKLEKCAECLKKEVKIIKTVGGCNEAGRCGVMYEDGTIGQEYFPVVGAKGDNDC